MKKKIKKSNTYLRVTNVRQENCPTPCQKNFFDLKQEIEETRSMRNEKLNNLFPSIETKCGRARKLRTKIFEDQNSIVWGAPRRMRDQSLAGQSGRSN